MDIQNLDPQAQKQLNQPFVKKEPFSREDQEFLDSVVRLVENKTINLHQPGTLISHPVYDKLSPEKQGKADFDGVNLLTQVRNIYELWKATGTPTLQVENMVHGVRLIKERIEAEAGDVYII